MKNVKRREADVRCCYVRKVGNHVERNWFPDEESARAAMAADAGGKRIVKIGVEDASGKLVATPEQAEPQK